MKTGGEKSYVWKYFIKTMDRKFADCTICGKQLRYFKNTTNMIHHLKRKHPIKPLKARMNIEEEESRGAYDRSYMQTAAWTTEVAEDGRGSAGFFQNSEPTIKEEPLRLFLFGGEEVDEMSNISQGPNNVDSLRFLRDNEVELREEEIFPYPNNSGLSDEARELPKVTPQGDNLQILQPSRKRRNLQLLSTPPEELPYNRFKEIDNALIKMIILDLQPLSFIEGEGFGNLCKELQPQYKLPSRKKLSSEILPQMYAKAVSELHVILEQIKNVAISVDIWSSDSDRRYLTATCHFIYNDEIRTPSIATKEILGDTIEEAVDVLTTILNEWNLNEKTTTVVADGSVHVWQPCIAYTLNQCVKDAFKSNAELDLILKKSRSLAFYFKGSVPACEKLKSVQEQRGRPVLKVKKDESNRWNSSFFMMERLLQIKDCLKVAIDCLPAPPQFLKDEEWTKLNDCVMVLKPLDALTVALLEEKYLIISSVIPQLRGLQNALGNITAETETGETLRNELLDNITRRLGTFETQKVIAKATFLDPRFKKIGFGLEINSSNAQKWVQEELTEIINGKALDPSQDQNCEMEDGIWAHFDRKVARAKTQITPNTMIRQYLEMPYLERTKNPLDFWRSYKSVFPEMYEMAVRYLPIPATAIPAERVFSEAGKDISGRRSLLSPKHLDKMIFLNSIL